MNAPDNIDDILYQDDVLYKDDTLGGIFYNIPIEMNNYVWNPIILSDSIVFPMPGEIKIYESG